MPLNTTIPSAMLQYWVTETQDPGFTEGLLQLSIAIWIIIYQIVMPFAANRRDGELGEGGFGSGGSGRGVRGGFRSRR